MTLRFNYDALGNRSGWEYVSSRGWMNFGRRDNGLNQYSSWENEYPDPPLHWGSAVLYDDNISPPDWQYPGNGVTMADGWIVGSYNALNQPRKIGGLGYEGTGNWMWFGYDPLGRCVKRWVSPSEGSAPNGTTYYYYEGWSLIEEAAAGSASRYYVHGARVDEVVKQMIQYNPAPRFFHYDARGHCTLQTDASGHIVEQYEYDAFGYPYFFDASGNQIGYSPWGNRFLFTGREWLSDLKLYDYRNRMYQPELGRFMQPDPKEFGAGEAVEVPYNFTDKDGLRLNGFTGPYNVTVLLAVVPGASGTFSLQVRQFDVSVEGKYVSTKENGAPRSRAAIEASKEHEDLHETHAEKDHDAMQNKIVRTGFANSTKAEAARKQEQAKLVGQFRKNREQDQRECKKGQGEWKPIILEERKK